MVNTAHRCTEEGVVGVVVVVVVDEKVGVEVDVDLGPIDERDATGSRLVRGEKACC